MVVMYAATFMRESKGEKDIRLSGILKAVIEDYLNGKMVLPWWILSEEKG